MTEFELKSLNTALDRLLKEGYIKNEEQRQILLDVYKEDKRPYNLIHDEINKLRFDKELLEEKLRKNLVIAGVEMAKKEEKETKPLSLEDITDFEKDGKSYIKVHYPDDTIRIIENRTDPYKSGKERFEEISKTTTLLSDDAKANATDIFEQSLAKSCTELDVKNIKEITTQQEFKKLTSEQQKKVVGTLKAIIGTLQISDEQKRRLTNESVEVMLEALGKIIYISPEDNIVTVCTPTEPSKDEVKTLKTEQRVTENGVVNTYTLSSLDEKGYKYDNSDLENTSDSYSTSENEEYVKSEEGEPDKELGSSYKPKAPWQKRKRNDSNAFINVSWAIVLLGIFTVVAVAAILSLFMY